MADGSPSVVTGTQHKACTGQHTSKPNMSDHTLKLVSLPKPVGAAHMAVTYLQHSDLHAAIKSVSPQKGELASSGCLLMKRIVPRALSV